MLDTNKYSLVRQAYGVCRAIEAIEDDRGRAVRSESQMAAVSRANDLMSAIDAAFTAKLVDSKGRPPNAQLSADPDPCETEPQFTVTGKCVGWLTDQTHREVKAKEDSVASLTAFVDERIKSALKPGCLKGNPWPP
jgi:hypothetical protein